jgi:hypoxanthine phosphoribosyltransferase
MEKPTLFISSSSEDIEIAREVEYHLYKDVQVTLWEYEISRPSRVTLDALASSLEKSDFAIFILNANDITESRGTMMGSPRDNVIFELGMFMGKVGRNRTFIIVNEGDKAKIPSDLEGFTLVYYSDRSDKNTRAALSPACTKIRNEIRTIISIEQGAQKVMTWDIYYKAIKELDWFITDDPDTRYRPDIIIGVRHGGSIVGGLLYYLHRRKIYFLTFWTKDKLNVYREGDVQSLKKICDSYGKTTIKILLVDDSLKSGKSMKEINDKVHELLKDYTIEIKSAVIVNYTKIDKEKQFEPDYYIYTDFTHFPYSPV